MAADLVAKLKLKPGHKALLIHPPEGYAKVLSPAVEVAGLSAGLAGQYDWVQVFVRSQADLESIAPRLQQALKPVSLLWIAFPKGSSKVQTDLTRDKGWDSLRGSDLKWINLVSVDETWSAFSLRPYKPGEARQSFR
jgi:hypothetical protein